MHRYGLILAGGRGTRFWPQSRRSSAKQVLNIAGERSMIQATVERLGSVIPPERIWILTNEHLRKEIIRQLPEVPAAQILAEPPRIFKGFKRVVQDIEAAASGEETTKLYNEIFNIR